jgi:hypothetical protein
MEVKHTEFSNWSRQYKSTPSAFVTPKNVSDLQEIVRNEERFPSPIVAIGSGHSNSRCNVARTGTAVSMKQFKAIEEPTESDITVGGGVTLIEVHRFLAKRKKQLPFTPEIGDATLGSVACCTLKDAALGSSSGIAAGMIKAIKFVDANGEKQSMQRGDSGWEMMISSHGLFCLIYEVTLDVKPMTLVIQNYVHLHANKPNFVEIYTNALRENDGIFGLLNASTGKMLLETRNISEKDGKPNWIERRYNAFDQRLFKYFNPIMGISESKRYGRVFRKIALRTFGFMHFSFRKGRKTFKNLKPIDYSHQYRWRWDFHFWAYPVSEFPTVVLPAFMKFLKEYKAEHPEFDERGIMACYRLRTEKQAVLSPTYEQDMMTLDPVRPITKRENIMKSWDDFCSAYNDFAVQHGGKCTFNQTKNLSKAQVEGAFGEQWKGFKKARAKADPENRFLSGYFKELMYG